MKARHGLDALLAKLAGGDELIVTEIDRLGRSTGEVIMLMDELSNPEHERGLLVQLIQAIATGLLTEKWPGFMLAFMNTLAGIMAAWITTTVAASFDRDTSFIRLVAVATFLVYLVIAYLWLRVKSAKGMQ